MESAALSQIVQILESHPDMTIATNRQDGYPQATTVSFVNDGLTIYFACGRPSQKANNIERDGRVSLAIDKPTSEWDSIIGLSMAADAEIISDKKEMRKVGELMNKKFPQIANLGEVDESEIAVVKLTPKIVSILDYSKGFGHHEEVEVKGGDIHPRGFFKRLWGAPKRETEPTPGL